MLISTDQEQGEVLRIGPPATVFPGNMALGATRDLGLARRAARITGQELRARGSTWTTLRSSTSTSTRSTRPTASARTATGRPLVAGFATVQVGQTDRRTTGVAATAKHFPGLGATEVNSDNGKSISEQTLAEIEHVNLPSFRAAITAGIDLVLAGAIVFPHSHPSITSLTPYYVKGMLRRKLHFKGVVITDALDAGALARLSPARVALGAIRAGDDELLEIGQTGVDAGRADLVQAYPAVLRAVRRHRLSVRRIDQSVRRILRLQWKLGLAKHPLVDPSRVQDVVGTPAHLAVAEESANRSITLLRNAAGLLPRPSMPGVRRRRCNS